MVVWYSDQHQRVVKQRGVFTDSAGAPADARLRVAAFRFDDTIELSAIRYAAR